MKTLREKTEELRREILIFLKDRDLIGDTILIEDPINYPSRLSITGQDGLVIEVEDEMGETLSFHLNEFSIDTLMDLVDTLSTRHD